MRRGFLYLLIVSVGLSALLGIVALLSDHFGETQVKVLLSTLCVAGASILAMACSAVWERGKAHAFALPGIGASILGFLLFLVGIWAEVNSNPYWKSATTLVIAATFAAHASLLFLASLAQRFRWVRPATIGATALLGSLLIYMIWQEGEFQDAWRIVGILAILGSAGTILTPVFQRMSGGKVGGEAETPGGTARCPHCGEPLPQAFLDAL